MLNGETLLPKLVTCHVTQSNLLNFAFPLAFAVCGGVDGGSPASPGVRRWRQGQESTAQGEHPAIVSPEQFREGVAAYARWGREVNGMVKQHDCGQRFWIEFAYIAGYRRPVFYVDGQPVDACPTCGAALLPSGLDEHFHDVAPPPGRR